MTAFRQGPPLAHKAPAPKSPKVQTEVVATPGLPDAHGQSGFATFGHQPLSYSQEILAIDNLHLYGRQTDIRQLLKILNLAKAGQSKSVLISGDAGMGKTALVSGLTQLVRNGIYARVVSLDMTHVQTMDDFPRQFYAAIDQECTALLREALETAQSYTTQLGFTWRDEDLKQAVGLVQLQSTIPTMGIPQGPRTEQVVKAIRNAMPALKKWTPGHSDALDGLVNVLLNPWLSAAVQWSNNAASRTRAANTVAKLPTIQDVDTSTDTPETLNQPVNQPFTSNPNHESTDISDITAEIALALQGLTQHLAGVQTALVFTFDHWESITRLPRGESSGIKQLMASLLSHQLQPQHQATAGHQLWLVSCRTDGQSQALGSALYAQFRNKLLLEGLSVKASQQLLERRLQSIGLGIDFAGVERLNYLTHGNPYWLRKVSDYLMERAQANRMDHLPISFIDKLNLKAPDLAEGGLFDILLTQVKLASSGNEGDVEPTLAILVRAFGTQPWTLNEALTHLPNPLAKGGHKGIGATILNRCLWIGLITPVDPDEVILANATPFTTRGRYQFDGRLLVEALTRMTQHQTYHDPHQEKLELLKQVLPMSVSSGELDPLKTQELLSLSRLMNDDTLVPFLTETLIEATQHEKPVVRASALNNLAFIDADASLALCLKALSDKDPLVREYALRNLQQLSLANLDPMSAKALYEQLFSLVDDTDDTIRTYAYGLLAQVDRLGLLESSVIPALAKGLSDATVSVRQVVMEALTHQPNKYTDAVTPYLMQGLTDPDTTVRIWAYKGVNLHHLENAIGLLSNALVTDPSDSVRVYAAEALSGMDSPEALTILTQALGNHALDEKVKVTIVRAMAKVPGWLTESTLGQVLKQPGPQPATLLWVTIQSLGRIGVTKPTAQLLQQQTHAQDSVVRFAAEKALERVQARLEQFRLYEQHWGDSDGQKAEELLGTNDAFVALGKGTNTNPYAELNDLTGADIDDAHLFAAVADDAY